MTISVQQVASFVRQVAAIASVVVGAIEQIPLPPTVRPVLIGIGGVVLAVEHYVSDPSTGTPTVPAAPVSPASNTGTAGTV